MKRSIPPVIACLLAASCFALPKQEEKPAVPPIVISRKAFTHRDVAGQQFRWAEQKMLKPFQAQLPPDQPWSRDALEFAREAVAAWADDPVMEDARANFDQQPAPEDKEALLGKRGAELIKKGCGDPLVLFLTNHFRFKLRNYAGLDKDAERAFALLENNKKYPRAVAWLAGLYADMILENRQQTRRRDDVDKRIPSLAAEALQAGDYAAENKSLFVFHALFFRQYLEKEHEAFAKVCETFSLSEWERRTLLGHIEILRAWKERGSNTGKGEKGFQAHFKTARAELTRAWKLRPDRPEAAAAMIIVVMEGGGGPQDTARLWFDRAIAAQFDYMPAYVALVDAYRPQWRGSHEAMLAFGRACIASGRYDTKVPLVFPFAVKTMVEDFGDWREIYQDPAIGPEFVAASKTSAENPARAADWRRRTGLLAVYAYATGDTQTAAKALEKIDNRLTKEAEELLGKFGFFDLPWILQDIQARNAPTRGRYEAAEKLYLNKKTEEALMAYESLLQDGCDGTTARLAQGRMEALKAEKALESGEWVNLSTEGWDCRGGEWIGSADGSLTPKPSSKPTIAIAPPRMGRSFELRADLDYTPPTEPDGNTFFVVLGFIGSSCDFGNCGFFLPPKQRAAFVFSSCNYHYSQESVRLPVEAKNRFWVQVWEEKITFFFNGAKVCDAVKNPWITGDWAQARFGFCAFDVIKGVSYRISNLQVRLLKTPPAPSALE